MKIFKYIVEDLDYIFIRAQDKDSHWTNLSMNQLTDEQFVSWATEKFGIKIRDDEMAKGTHWTKEQKIDFLNDMSERAGQPVVAMLKRGKR